MQRRFDQVDVFASDAFSGNPLAVVHDAHGMTTEQMLAFTAWTNLSEATFLLPPTDPAADYRVRIFCPGRELPFAGHPTLGTCAAWLAAGGVPQRGDRIVQECGAGAVPIRIDGDRLAFAAPPMLRSGPIEPDLLATRLDALAIDSGDVIEAAWIDNGPGWMGVLLASSDAVLDVSLPSGTHPAFDVGLVGLRADGDECAIEVRGLFADAGGLVREDPVTGSLNASVAQWLEATGHVSLPYVASQGTNLDRRGRVVVERVGDDIWIGGRVDIRITGIVDIAAP
ncbi:MAG: PhzF family phenazine biosynthesis protein [Ilumatobacter sp.]|jgi:PhzF family phenazine biosynthesis protein|uniref:PhzF family phenazine biosynthesis protein n=1 Tax=Ilumatobacter sp. TaxID=1967498 RepID=UPI003918FDAB